MAQIKIYGLGERLRPRREQLSDVLHSCVVEAFAYPADKRAHRFIHLDEDDFFMPAGRTADYTILEIALFSGRTVAAKKELYRLIFDRFEHTLGIAPMDVEVTLFESPRHDWAMRGSPGDELDLPYRVDV